MILSFQTKKLRKPGQTLPENARRMISQKDTKVIKMSSQTDSEGWYKSSWTCRNLSSDSERENSFFQKFSGVAQVVSENQCACALY